MISRPRPSVRSISDSSRPTRSHQRRRTSSLWRTNSMSPPVFHDVGVAGDRGQRLLLAVAADQDRQPWLDRRRVVADAPPRDSAGRAPSPVPSRQHVAHELGRLVEPVEPLAEARPELDPEGLVLALEPGAADAEDRPPVAHVVERRRQLHRQRRVPEGVGADHQPERRARRHGGPAGEDQVALEDRAAPVALDRIQVIPRPERVVAELVGALADALERGPVDPLTPGQHADLDLTRHLDLRPALGVRWRA